MLLAADVFISEFMADNGSTLFDEDGDSSDPDDNAAGGTITFTFDSPVAVGQVALVAKSEMIELQRRDLKQILISRFIGQVPQERSRVLVRIS